MKFSALGPLPQGPVATLGKGTISHADFRAIYDLKLMKFEAKKRAMPPRVDGRYRRTITERLLRQTLLAREAKAIAVEYDPAELASEQQKARERVREWDKDLGRRGESNKTLKDLLVARLRETEILKKTIDLSVGDDDVSQEFERIKTNFDKDTPRLRIYRLTFGSADLGGEKQARAKAEEVRKLLRAEGANVADVAAEHCPGPRTGNLGLRRQDRLQKSLAEGIDGVEPGHSSALRAVDDGFELLYLMDRYPPGLLPLEALSEQIHTSLVGRKRQEEGKKLVESLYKKYQVTNLMESHLDVQGI